MVNGKRGNLTHVPVHYLDQSLSFDELVALYRVADVALISSLRDGMNLVAYEFIACQVINPALHNSDVPIIILLRLANTAFSSSLNLLELLKVWGPVASELTPGIWTKQPTRFLEL